MDEPFESFSPQSSRRSFTRGIARAAVFLLLALLSVRLLLIQGWWRPVRIVGGSMADAFYGPHLTVRCRDCGMCFRCGSEHPPIRELAVCPNCGCPDNPVDTTRVIPGQRVCIDRGAKLISGLGTWQAVAFRPPSDPDRLIVKRIVAGGPGRVAIRDGDIYLNDRIQQKNLAQIRELRILVHDDQYRCSLANRWQPRQSPSCWKPTRTGYRAVTPSKAVSAIDWLDYVQWTCWPNSAPAISRTERVPILDHDPYNHSLSRGNLHPVSDLMLVCQLQFDGPGVCVLRITSRSDVFEWALQPMERACQLKWNGAIVAQSAYAGQTSSLAVEMAVCDHRVLAALDGATLFQFDYRPSSGPAGDDPVGLSVGVAGGSVCLEFLRVYRDVHYSGPGGAHSWEVPRALTAAHWFVLGDNVPMSIDGRLWGAIEDRHMLGPVRAWPL
jgi:signal peptidase I